MTEPSGALLPQELLVIFQGLGLGIIYLWSKNLLVLKLSHGLFDMGAMAYFHLFTAKRGSTRPSWSSAHRAIWVRTSRVVGSMPGIRYVGHITHLPCLGHLPGTSTLRPFAST